MEGVNEINNSDRTLADKVMVWRQINNYKQLKYKNICGEGQLNFINY
jgi:hypothetical protein